jgi:hypothetical protein
LSFVDNFLAEWEDRHTWTVPLAKEIVDCVRVAIDNFHLLLCEGLITDCFEIISELQLTQANAQSSSLSSSSLPLSPSVYVSLPSSSSSSTTPTPSLTPSPSSSPLQTAGHLIGNKHIHAHKHHHRNITVAQRRQMEVALVINSEVVMVHNVHLLTSFDV